MSVVDRFESVDLDGVGGKVPLKVSDRIDPSSRVVLDSRIDFESRVDPGAHVDPEIIDSLVPIIAGGVIFVAAIITNSAYVILGFDSNQVVSVTDIACVAGIMAYGIFRQSKLFEQTMPKDRAFDALAVSCRLGGVFVLLFTLLGLLGIVSRYGLDVLCLWIVTSYALMFIALTLVSLYRRLIFAEGRMQQRIALYGRAEMSAAIGRALLESERNVVLVGIYEDTCDTGNADAPAHGLNDLIEFARTGRCDRVILALPLDDYDRISQVMDRLSAVPIAVDICTDVTRLQCRVQGAVAKGSMLLLKVQSQPLSAGGTIFKTVMDNAIAALALVLLAPLLALIAVAIKLDSRGPVFFVQPRGGYRGKTINVFKFRSMTVLETGAEVTQARRHDPRITRVGRFLRRTSLDELPQLLNVLRGELSLVGPRPHALAHDTYYAKIVDKYAIRHKIKPGITGWAQVNGYRSETQDPDLMRERVRHDLYYINNWSPWLDVKILIRSVRVLFWDRYAY